MNIALRLLLPLALLAAPYFAHAQVGIWLPCRETSAYSEGRTVYIARYMQINTVGMLVDDLEDRYCVTPEKCVALGYCKAASQAEQAAADKAHPGAAAERARLEREQRQREAQAELQRKAAEAERNRKAAEVAHETQRLGGHREAEARRLVEMRERADAARRGSSKVPPGSVMSPSGGSEGPSCTPQPKRGREGFLPGFRYTRQKAEEILRANVNRTCENAGYSLASAVQCTSAVVTSTATGNTFESWGCSVDYVCTKATIPCRGKAGSGTAQ